MVANAAEPFDPPEQIVIRESLDGVNRLAHGQIITKPEGIEESRARSRSQTPFANISGTDNVRARLRACGPDALTRCKPLPPS